MERPSLHVASVLLTSDERALVQRLRDERRRIDPRASDAGTLRDALARGLRLLADDARLTTESAVPK